MVTAVTALHPPYSMGSEILEWIRICVPPILHQLFNWIVSRIGNQMVCYLHEAQSVPNQLYVQTVWQHTTHL